MRSVQLTIVGMGNHCTSVAVDNESSAGGEYCATGEARTERGTADNANNARLENLILNEC